MRYGSVCSGVEAASVAWEPLGWEPVFFSEIEPFPSAVLAHHWPDVPNHGDMTQFEEWGYERGTVDVLVGGTPCQSFSIAGLRGGLSDERGNLALTYCRMVDRLRPRWFVWENVPGVLSSNGGRDFSSIISAMAQLGYSVCWRVLDAQNFGVPQRRRRVFLVGHSSGDWRYPAKVLFESKSGTRDFEARRKTRKENTGGSIECFAGNVKSDIAATLQTTMHDYSRADGFNTVVYESHPSDSRTKEMGDACSTVRARWGTGGGNTPLVLHANHVAPTITSSGPPYSRTGNQHSEVDALVVHGTQDPIVSDKAMPIQLNCGQENVVCIHDKATRFKGGGDTRKNDGSGNGLGITEGGPMYTLTSADRHSVYSQSKVRRLTPMEAERLQGFPDGHTDIGWKDKPTPDSHRYKAMGNSMAVPVMAWIGKRIQEVENG